MQKPIDYLQYLYVWFYMAFRCPSVRRLILKTVYSILFLTVFGMSLSFMHSSAVEQTPASQTQRNLPLTIGSHSAILTLRVQNTDWQLGTPAVSPTEYRQLRKRTITTIPLYATTAPMTNDIDAPDGTITVTLDKIDQNIVLYLQSDADCDVEAVLFSDATQEPVIRSVKAQDTTLAAAQSALLNTAYAADSAYYIESDDFHLYTSRLDTLSSLGSTVYTCAPPAEGITLSRAADDTLSVSVPLHGTPDSLSVCTMVLTCGALADWNEPLAASTALTMDATANNFHILSDGVYQYEPTTYSPRLTTDDTQAHIYLSAAAWLLGPCADIHSGSVFNTIGKSILYSYLDRINDSGFIPTQPTSTWLSEGYGITGGFYDTRFNFDTIRCLIYADKFWNDATISQGVHKMLQFYLQFAESTAFTANGLPFVPDYGHPLPNTLTHAQAEPSCSLNHYLTEGTFLLRAGYWYQNPTYFTRGLQILDTLNQSAASWIRPTGDLWYAIRPDGQMEKNDYIEVTYSDLASTLSMLKKLGLSDRYTGLQSLYDSKQDWLLRAGYTDVIPQYTVETINTPTVDAMEWLLLSQSNRHFASDMLYSLLSEDMRYTLLPPSQSVFLSFENPMVTPAN